MTPNNQAPQKSAAHIVFLSLVTFATVTAACGDDVPWREMKIRATDDVTILSEVWGNTSEDLFLGGDQLIRYNGNQFDIQDTQVQDHLNIHGISGSSPSDVIAVGGVILKFDGISWSLVDDLEFGWVADVWVGPDQQVHIVGGGTPGVDERAKLYHFDGIQWQDLRTDIEADLESVWGVDSQNVFAAGSRPAAGHGYESVVLHFDGSAWTEMETGFRAQLKSIWGRSADDVYAVGWLGKILHYDGVAWEEMEFEESQTLESVWGRSSTDIFVAEMEAGKIFHYDGSWWKPETVCSNCTIESIWGTEDGSVFAVGTRFKNYKYHGVIYEYTWE